MSSTTRNGFRILLCATVILTAYFNFLEFPDDNKIVGEPIVSKERPPAMRTFVYHALPGTHDFDTEKQLENFCDSMGKLCFGYKYCRKTNKEASVDLWVGTQNETRKLSTNLIENQRNCHKRFSQRTNVQDELDFETLTAYRNTECCPAAKEEGIEFFGLINTLPRDGLDNDQFRNRAFHSDAFTFTIVTNPGIQFIISYHYHQKHKYQFTNYTLPDSLEESIDQFYGWKMNEGNLSVLYAKVLSAMVNLQSKTLGFSGDLHDSSWNDIFEYLETVNFVCLMDKLCLCWQLIRTKLNWPNQYFDRKSLIKTEKSIDQALSIYTNLTLKYRNRLAAIQNADYGLLEYAETRFNATNFIDYRPFCR